MLQKATDWFDTGTFSSLFKASKYVHQYQTKNKKPIGSPEVAAINSGLVKKQEMLKRIQDLERLREEKQAKRPTGHYHET